MVTTFETWFSLEINRLKGEDVKSNCKMPFAQSFDWVLGSRPLKGFFDKFVAGCGTDITVGCQGQVDTLKKIRMGV